MKTFFQFLIGTVICVLIGMGLIKLGCHLFPYNPDNKMSLDRFMSYCNEGTSGEQYVECVNSYPKVVNNQ
jgi:hypothetical protein